MLRPHDAGAGTDVVSTETAETMPEETAAALQAVLDEAPIGQKLPGVIATVITPEGSWTGRSRHRRGRLGTSSGGERPRPHRQPHEDDDGDILLQLVGEGLLSLDDPISM